MSWRSTNGTREIGRTNVRSKYFVPVRSDPFSQSVDRQASTSGPSSTEQFKFLSGNYEQIQIKKNYSVVEAAKPTSNFVYLARSLTYGKGFCVSVTRTVTENHSDFSFIIGFTSCSSASITNNKKHLTVQCCPTGCGGHSQQLKTFNASKIGSKVIVDRQLDGEIYFAIDGSMPIRIQFDRNSCGINLATQKLLTPYVQLSGSALALMVATNVRKLNIYSTMSVGTATAYGPPIHKQTSPAIEANEAHQAFVAPSDVDTKFIVLKYPQNDVKVSVNRLAVLRKNERGERFVFYVDKIFKLNVQVTVQVTKIYDADKYNSDFEFGVMTVHSDHSEMMVNEFFMDSLSATVQNASHCLKIHHNSKVNDKYTFLRIG